MTGPDRPDCLIVVPMKDPSASKTRLGPGLTQAQRQTLARLLFRRTIDVLRQARTLPDAPRFDLAIVTSSIEIADIAERMGATVIAEGARDGLSRAVETAARWAGNRSYASLCVIPADLAAPDPADLVRLLCCGRNRTRAVICPATDLGTNALLVSPPTAIPFLYGPNSAIRHLRAAERAGLNPVLLRLDSLQFDIDTAASLERAMRDVPELPRMLGQA
ncbi:2-phospho-L-lactate guanylyltransferase [Pukyongiella litopenaei]|uniref:3-phospho-D-glycerate guanylyltransferase n=1 Tax=Pukyongiella litopenaei TaxID=2605946 RepID=A0A2S0MPZ5_9RHOB|nr:2-phospho-L-lactate guanylyltransferase [Pukyongiella litopenaei]AVO37938.1 2-phospho-L-lactate guanylyltransferase [Pukyongiella litopenaei]